MTDSDFNTFFSVNHLYPVGEEFRQKAFYKYWAYSRVIEMLERKELTFVYPGLWKDPFEKMYLETDYSDFGYTRPRIFCMCVATTTDNEEAAWKIYADTDESTIRCRIRVQVLYHILDDFAGKNNCKIYISPIDYSLKKSEIQGLSHKGNPHYEKYFTSFNEENYIRLMCLKRRAFKYENELRIFIVPEKELTNDSILRIPVVPDLFNSLFQTFTIQPYGQIRGDSPKARIRLLQQNLEKHEIKADILARYPAAKVYNSSLYSRCQAVTKVYK